VQRAAPAATLAPRSSTSERKPLSGEIAYRMTAKAPLATKDLGELHYFVSGAHWKHVDQDGATPALYDPAQGEIISDPISIRAREFDASFWALPQPG
jgi:hypothetical protein